MGNKNFLFSSIFILIFSFIFLVNVGGVSATICNNSLISNSSNKILSSIIGNNSLSYYSYEGYHTNKIFYPKILNLTGVNKNSYFVIVSYKFSHTLNTTTVFKFILPDKNKCNELIFYGGHNLVELYNLSKIISPEGAASVAKQSDFNILNPQLTLIPSEEYKNNSSFLVPGYSVIQNSKIIYINALDSKVRTEGLIRPLKTPMKINSPKKSKDSSKIKSFSLKYFFLIFFLILISIIYIIKKIKNEKK